MRRIARGFCRFVISYILALQGCMFVCLHLKYNLLHIVIIAIDCNNFTDFPSITVNMSGKKRHERIHPCLCSILHSQVSMNNSFKPAL